jgi:hypothetical protein
MPAGLYWDPFEVKFVGLETLRSTCDKIVEDARTEREQRKAERRKAKEARQEERAERKEAKRQQRAVELEFWMQQQMDEASDDDCIPDAADFVTDMEYSSDEPSESGRDSESEVGVESEPEDELALSGPMGRDKLVLRQEGTWNMQGMFLAKCSVEHSAFGCR